MFAVDNFVFFEFGFEFFGVMIVPKSILRSAERICAVSGDQKKRLGNKAP